MFLYAYRAFIEALANKDTPRLKKMCEKSLYRLIESNYNEMDKLNGKYFQVAKNIKLKMKLLDTKIIKGVSIERSKNLSSHYYSIKESKDAIEYEKISKTSSAVDFNQLLKDRKPQGINTSI
jgi:hypothetical protein